MQNHKERFFRLLFIFGWIGWALLALQWLNSVFNIYPAFQSRSGYEFYHVYRWPMVFQYLVVCLHVTTILFCAPGLVLFSIFDLPENYGRWLGVLYCLLMYTFSAFAWAGVWFGIGWVAGKLKKFLPGKRSKPVRK
jgi:hypothetical protein